MADSLDRDDDDVGYQDLVKNLRQCLKSVADLGLSGASFVQTRVLPQLREAFDDGDLAAILRACRRVDGSRFTPDDVDTMVRDVVEFGRALDVPYCFSRGARALEEAAVVEVGHISGDVEVGLYAASPASPVAEWHCDESYNFTFGLYGAKEWQLATPSGGGPRAPGARGLFDVPSNRATWLANASPDLTRLQRVLVEPGTLLYVPPGVWHRVVPMRSERATILSANLRLGRIPACQFMGDVLQSALTAAAVESQPSGGPFSRLASVAMRPLGPTLADSAWREVVEGVAEHLSALVQGARVPRALPCHPALSDGRDRAATLPWLVRRGCVTDDVPEQMAVHPMVAMTLTQRAAPSLTPPPLNFGVLILASAPRSGGFEYFRFTIIAERSVAEEVVGACKKGRVDKHKLSSQSAVDFVRVLLHANVLVARADEPPKKSAKKRRRRVEDASRATASAPAAASARRQTPTTVKLDAVPSPADGPAPLGSSEVPADGPHAPASAEGGAPSTAPPPLVAPRADSQRAAAREPTSAAGGAFLPVTAGGVSPG